MNLQHKIRTILSPRTCLNTILVAGLCVGMSTLGVAQTGGTGTGGTGTSGTGTTGTTGTGTTGTSGTATTGTTGTNNTGSATSGAADLNTLQSTLGLNGKNENGVLEYEFIRTDLNPTLKGVGTTKGFLAHGFFHFWNTSEAANATSTGTTGTNGSTGTTATTPTTAASLMAAELVFQEKEVAPFMKAMASANASANGIMISAEHNHYLMENPRLVFIHLEGAGDANQMANIVAGALQAANVKLTSAQDDASVAGLDTFKIQDNLGARGHARAANVYEVVIPRTEQITSCGAVANPFMTGTANSGTTTSNTGTTTPSATGSATFGTFSPAYQAVGACLNSGGVNAASSTTTAGATTGATTSTTTGLTVPPQLAAFSEVSVWANGNNSNANNGNGNGNNSWVSGELALLPTEVQPTIEALQRAGFDISAVHNHTALLSPQLMYVHFSAQGDAYALTQSVRQAMATNRIAAGQQP